MNSRRLDFFREPAEVAALRADFPTADYAEPLAAILAEDYDAELVSLGDGGEDFPPLARRANVAAFVRGYCARCRETAAILSELETSDEPAPEPWSLPDSYAGATWEGWLSAGFGQSRDSDSIERVNFGEALAALEAAAEYPGGVQVIREGHWLVGWVEWIAIRPDCPAAVREAARLLAAVESYPVLSEDKLSEIEAEEAAEGWEDFGRDGARDAAREAVAREAREAGDSDDIAALADAAIEAMTAEEFDAAVTGGMPDYYTESGGPVFNLEKILSGEWPEGNADPEEILADCRLAAEIIRDGARFVSEIVRLADPAAPLAPDSGIPAAVAREARNLARRAARLRLSRYIIEAVAPSRYTARPLRPTFGGYGETAGVDPFAVSGY